ncbi:GTPase IMAP family member 4-like [Mytilus edulis]|uniref:GTPase IMAP family member 4-like n=1 Tax=Mytilus edulis TaxID=6550 RepID=UPI0039EDFCCD
MSYFILLSTRIALIGISGAGKSTIGNTLLGRKKFETSPAAESVTLKCDTAEAVLESGRKIKVADTPGVYDTENVHMVDEVIKFLEFLSPGPHAFLIVLTPNRISKRDVNILDEVQTLFRDDPLFFRFAILVFVRKSDIIGDYGCSEDIHEYIKDHTNRDILNLYEKCGERAIAVENRQPWEGRNVEAIEIMKEIDKLDGVYFHELFDRAIQNEELRSKVTYLKKKSETKNMCLIS